MDVFHLSRTFRNDTKIPTGPSFGAIHILFGDHYLDTYLKNHDRWTLKIKHRCLSEVPQEILQNALTFKRRIKSHLPFAGIIRSSPYSTGFQDKG